MSSALTYTLSFICDLALAGLFAYFIASSSKNDK